MKILLVHDYGTPTGGAENQMLRLRELFRERGHDARLFASRASLVPSTFEADYGCMGATGKLQVLTQTINPWAYAALRRVMRDFQPDVIHVRMFLWQLSPAILPLLQSFPAVYQTATYKSICPSGTKILPDGSPCSHLAGAICRKTGCLTPQTWLSLMVQRWCWWKGRGAFDAIVALSHNMKNLLERNGLQPVEVIYNGIGERPIRPSLKGIPVIAYAGRLAKEKGLFVLLDALERLCRQGLEFRFLVAGDGPLRQEFLNALGRIGLRDRTDFLGYVPRAEMEQAFEAAWVQAIPSLWDEPFGNVATEALMRGTAVVNSASGGLAEIVENGRSGFHVPPNDAGALAEALARLITDRELAEAMGQAGRARALTHFSERTCVDAFLALYERLSRRDPHGNLAPTSA
jgi:glycosyltransferase involved in cell wall biosynthesis